MNKKTTTMREPTYYILASLLDGPLHGYGIIKRSTELSDGRLTLSAGTLYSALDRLADSAMVEVTGTEIVDGRARRYYQLTGDGHSAVRVEGERLTKAASIVISRPSLTMQSNRENA